MGIRSAKCAGMLCRTTSRLRGASSGRDILAAELGHDDAHRRIDMRSSRQVGCLYPPCAPPPSLYACRQFMSAPDRGFGLHDGRGGRAAWADLSRLLRAHRSWHTGTPTTAVVFE